MTEKKNAFAADINKMVKSLAADPTDDRVEDFIEAAGILLAAALTLPVDLVESGKVASQVMGYVEARVRAFYVERFKRETELAAMEIINAAKGVH